MSETLQIVLVLAASFAVPFGYVYCRVVLPARREADISMRLLEIELDRLDRELGIVAPMTADERANEICRLKREAKQRGEHIVP